MKWTLKKEQNNYGYSAYDYQGFHLQNKNKHLIGTTASMR